MTSLTVYQKFLESFACAHVNDGFMEDDGEMMLGCLMNLQGSPLLGVKKLKDKGYGFFIQNYSDRAAACYDEVCKLLSLSLGFIGGDDVQSLCDLVVSLNSNLAACALKLEKFQAVWDLCSMILDTFPRNVKALFRRALASMKLTRFMEAELYLVEALVAESRNKDVLRELEVVKGHLLIKENGKRVLEAAYAIGVDGKSKNPVHVPEIDRSMKVNESVIMEVTEIKTNSGTKSDLRIKDTEIVKMAVSGAQSTCVMDLNTNTKKNEHVSKKSILEFSKKGEGNSKLRISGQTYQKFIEGKKVSFYHKRELSTITIRILNFESLKERRTSRESCKKKRR